ncbi:Os04g0522625 [Oryza sativa Japonica Group]|uniref:Os04g0522625 protein n=1 Tax=Oryza sativa subsp. japonica TaxID=39947 RepID=A0A0P0WCL4_ORYSJ|nr:hypothetical protein EE612_024479 [Oryza sativa]BAS90134.1 Os04g0522625 [Oryza sativa Japonica Group]
MLTTRASGRGLTATHRESFIRCRPPTWSWHRTVRKSLSVCGTSPNVSAAKGHAGYRLSRRKHVVSSHPAGNHGAADAPPPPRPVSSSASAAATVFATRDIASATSCITPLKEVRSPKSQSAPEMLASGTWNASDHERWRSDVAVGLPHRYEPLSRPAFSLVSNGRRNSLACSRLISSISSRPTPWLVSWKNPHSDAALAMAPAHAFLSPAPPLVSRSRSTIGRSRSSTAPPEPTICTAGGAMPPSRSRRSSASAR